MRKGSHQPQAQRKKVFEDAVCGHLSVPSSWERMRQTVSKKSIECQTGEELYNPQEAEVQTGRYANVYQSQVESVSTGTGPSLLDFIASNESSFMPRMKRKNKQEFPINWKQQVEDGYFTIDYDVETDPDTRLEAESWVEYTDVRKNVSVQTEKISFPPMNDPSDGEGKNSEGKDGVMDDQPSSSSSLFVFKQFTPVEQPRALLSFLNKALPLVTKALENNLKSTAFDFLLTEDNSNNNNNTNNNFLEDGNQENSMNAIKLWKYLQVDLEKKKIIFPDWSKAKHIPGIILKMTTTRNKERIYDIEYDDGSKQLGVREEHIRMVESNNSSSNSKNKKAAGDRKTSSTNARLFEGMRVHCRVSSKASGITKYFLSRIIKINKNSYDVEILENSTIETNVTVDDLILGGLPEGSPVEARKPLKVILQTTSLSWNANGSMIGITYGKNDIEGFCDLPGVFCGWNVFSKTFHYQKPDLLVDHSSCLMCLAFHPIIPTIVVLGSFNGEIILYDLLSSVDKPVAISTVTEYAHKEPILNLKWIKNNRYSDATTSSGVASGNDLESWFIVSCGSDGKILFWSILNKFVNPMKGYLLSKGKLQRRQYPIANGATSFTFSSPAYLSMNNSNNINLNQYFSPKWMMIGEANGEIIRCQMTRLPNQLVNPVIPFLFIYFIIIF
jgi:hypothetical protein